VPQAPKQSVMAVKDEVCLKEHENSAVEASAQSACNDGASLTPPPRPPPPKIVAPGGPTEPVELTKVAEDEELLPVNLGKRNPKLYELVALSREGSFWWDSVDANALKPEDDEVFDMNISFDESLSVGTVTTEEQGEGG